MATRSTTSAEAASSTGLTSNTVYVVVGVSLFLGLLIGYFVVGKNTKPGTSSTQTAVRQGPGMGNHPKLTLEQMKQMADVQASTLLEKSKKEPKNAALLVQIAGIYEATHQFKQAAGYYQDALKIDPKNVPARTAMASCLYYSGDVDGALSQLNQSLKYSPKDANSLFNLGMIRYQGKKDPAGAIAVWEQLLKSNPNLDRKPIVEQMIAEAKTNSAGKASSDIKN
jgi:cytochrome c-type biogenesis protein CcmH/NrfG